MFIIQNSTHTKAITEIGSNLPLQITDTFNSLKINRNGNYFNISMEIGNKTANTNTFIRTGAFYTDYINKCQSVP